MKMFEQKRSRMVFIALESYHARNIEVSPAAARGSSAKGLIRRVLRSGIEAGYSQCMNKANIKRRQFRKLRDLISIGPAMLRDFKLLGVDSVADLARQSPERLYKKLCRITGERQDICVLDAFRAGVAQARNARLPVEKCQWWYWSRQRKTGRAS
jgi:hypothetical protein